jgi:hypothetical protein
MHESIYTHKPKVDSGKHDVGADSVITCIVILQADCPYPFLHKMSKLTLIIANLKHMVQVLP